MLQFRLRRLDAAGATRAGLVVFVEGFALHTSLEACFSFGCAGLTPLAPPALGWLFLWRASPSTPPRSNQGLEEVRGRMQGRVIPLHPPSHERGMPAIPSRQCLVAWAASTLTAHLVEAVAAVDWLGATGHEGYGRLLVAVCTDRLVGDPLTGSAACSLSGCPSILTRSTATGRRALTCLSARGAARRLVDKPL